MSFSKLLVVRLVLVFAAVPLSFAAESSALGVFEDHSDVGVIAHPGTVKYDAAKKSYMVTGSGANIWLNSDAFQFVWKKVSGDVSLTADIQFPNKGGNEHKKAVLMIRESLDADSPYVDVALHGNGLTSLQYRDEKGGTTREIQSSVSAPAQFRIVRQGDYASVWLRGPQREWEIAAGSPRILFHGGFYVGIGVCAHDKDAVEQAVFSNLDLTSSLPKAEPALFSMLETITVSSMGRRVVYSSPGRFEAPNWTPDGTFLFNRDGHIVRMPISGGTPTSINTGFAVHCNNDHGISPDHKFLAISDSSQEPHQSVVYVVPIDGGNPRSITRNSPSYWHGWSPDGTTLAFVGQRNGEFDIYSIPATGGDEKRLTTAVGLDDGPEYSPDGKYIYFNSERTGHMQIWRMRPDGSEQVQITDDEFNNWFPHISPDGKWMIILSYEKDVKGHPENKDVMLRLMSLEDKKISILARLFGGQGTINVPSWSPDSTKLAFVSYELVAVPIR